MEFATLPEIALLAHLFSTTIANFWHFDVEENEKQFHCSGAKLYCAFRHNQCTILKTVCHRVVSKIMSGPALISPVQLSGRTENFLSGAPGDVIMMEYYSISIICLITIKNGLQAAIQGRLPAENECRERRQEVRPTTVYGVVL